MSRRSLCFFSGGSFSVAASSSAFSTFAQNGVPPIVD
jgi:hypothetical protein